MEKQEYRIMYEIENDYWWYHGLHELVLGTLKKYFGERKDIALLDAGCGTGRMLELLADYKNREGFDYSPEAIGFCQERGLKKVWQEDLTKWQPAAEKYDCIISLDVLYHAAIDDDLAVIKKFWQALKPGGALILNLPAFNFLTRIHDVAVWTKRRYERKGLVRQLRTAGFEIEKGTYRLFFLFFIVMFRKVAEKMFKTKKPTSDFSQLPLALNSFLISLVRLENKLILNGFTLPLGNSVFVVARKG